MRLGLFEVLDMVGVWISQAQEKKKEKSCAYMCD